ncbi:MAG: 5-formyltetrahydrofolate cyclo-ligase [Erysipelotrichaceae bacterium]
MDNSEIRKRLIEKRATLSHDERVAFSKSINRFVEPLLADVQTIGIYVPFKGEVLLDLPANKTYCAPLIEGDTMQFAKINGLWKQNRFGIEEPFNSTLCVPELLLIPLVAYTSKGDRLGMGKGFYDRYLAHYTGKRVGIAYSFQKCDCIMVNNWDEKLHFVVNEEGIEQF